MLSDREKNLVKIGYLAGFEKAWYTTIDADYEAEHCRESFS